MTPRALLARASAKLQACGCTTARLDAELLLCHTLNNNRSWLIAHADDALDETSVSSFHEMLKRRMQREPVAYITGEKEFWSRPFDVSPAVLIPRPETEHLIEAALAHFPDQQAAYSFCDIGSGSGCIAITLACEYPHADITATDISADALAVARRNAERHEVLPRMHWRHGNLLNALRSDDGPFDLIVSNPPYVSRDEMSSLETELAFEPRHALSDEEDGLTFLRLLVRQAADRLTPNGLLIVETGQCGLPKEKDGLLLMQRITDLAGHLRGGVYSR